MARFAMAAVSLASLMVCVSCVGDTQTRVSTDPSDDDSPSEDPPTAEPVGNEEPVSELVAKIRTRVDPAYEYEYERTKFVPPEGKTLLVLGQTLDDINDLTAAFPELRAPGGWAAYWAIPNTDGLKDTVTTGSGDRQNHQVLLDRFPNSAMHSAVWMVGTWDVAKNAAWGAYDDVIRGFSRWAKNVDAPIYLRIGYEFDGPHNELEPSDYVRAYQRFVDITREEGVDNVAFVWHSYASEPYKGYPVESWYPGDDYVDWVAVSMFGHLYGPEPGPNADAVFDFARSHKKPMMIAEASPVRGIMADDLDSWNTWFVNLFSLAYERNVKAISFINANWSEFAAVQPLNWQDARLQNNQTVADAFFMETAKAKYLNQSPELFEQLGFAP
ncbi:MAG: glycosyl hydrolase [Myxococcota bacterium]